MAAVARRPMLIGGDMTAEPDVRALGRRDMLRAGAGAAAGLSAFTLLGQDPQARAEARHVDEVDYIVIGSGPGGAPLAANLAEAGFDVLVLEAGPPQGDRTFYEVPSFSNMAAASDEMIRWDYYVQHYSDINFNKTDTKWVHGRGGVLYPRASTIGGCTAHNAMITMYPEHSDWSYIQRLTGDRSWAPEAMWRHWQEGVLSWLNVEFPPLEILGVDGQLAAIVAAGKDEASRLGGGDVVVGDERGINKRENVDKSAQGFFFTPQATEKGRRRGPRERLLAVAAGKPHRLTIVTDALAERIVLERTADGKQRAVAVEYLAGRHLFGASPRYKPTTPQQRAAMRRSVKVRAGGEVIVAGGAYGSPQLLMLSGIGPKDHLTQMGVPVKIDLPGVGTNLQDRYEVPVVTQHQPFYSTALCTYNKGIDPCLIAWEAQKSLGLNALGYGSNGVVGGIKRRWSGRHGEMFIFGNPSDFRGYAPGFDSGYIHERFTWLVLKGYSESRIGTVRLRSSDPTRPPLINKRNFNDGAGGGKDMAAILDGIKMIRRINKLARKGNEIWPGPMVTDDDLENWVRREAWGHHASCTNPIGPASDRNAVLDGKFRVYGTANLRVVDASAFPRIPGLFIWAPTAILAEKASEDILSAVGYRTRSATRTRR